MHIAFDATDQVGAFYMVKKALSQRELLEKFKSDAIKKTNSRPWFVVAKGVEEALKELEGSKESIRPVLEEATGLSWGVINRYLSVLRRVHIIAVARDIPVEELMSRGFNGMEVAVRLYDRLPDEGFESLIKLRDGAMSLEDVRAKLANSPEGNAVHPAIARGDLLRRRYADIAMVERSLSRESEDLFGKGSIVRRRPGLRYFRRTGFEVYKEGGGIICGLDLMIPDPALSRNALDVALAPAILISSYYRRFYLVFSRDDDAEFASSAVDALKVMGVRSVGVMRVLSELGIETILEPSGPLPDRTKRYEFLRSKFLIGRLEDKE